MNITLEKNTTATCTNLTIHQDYIVEGNEMYHLNLTSNDPDVIINGDVSVQTQIVIEDSTGKCINVFNNMELLIQHFWCSVGAEVFGASACSE